MAEQGMAYLTSIRGIIKIVETVLIVITMGMWFGIYVGWPYFITGTIMTAFYATIALATQNMLLGPSRVAEIILYSVSFLFLIISSIILFVNMTGSLPTACGVFCILTGLVYGVDVFFTFRVTDDPTS